MTTENPNRKLDGFKAILGFIADPVIVIDCKGQILAANNILGKYTQPGAELVNRNILDLKVVNENYSTLIKNNLRKRLRGEEIEPYEIKIIGKDGAEVSLEINAKKIEYENEQLIVIILRDVSKRLENNKKVQEALVESEARFRHFVEVAQEGIWVIDNDFVTTFVNPYMVKMLGYQGNEVLGKKLTEFLDPEWIDTITGIIRKFTSNDQQNQYEYAFPHKNGGHVYTIVTLSVLSDVDNKKVGVLAVVSDITQRKRAEKALKASEELSKTIVANAPIGIATSRSDYHFATANEAFCNIIGYSEAELQKLTFKDINAPDTIERSIKGITALEKGEVPVYSDEKKYIRKDGTVITGKIIVTPIMSAKGKLALFVVQLEDITKRKQLEEEVRSSEERFRAISTSAMDAIILNDAKDQVLYWNPAAEKMFGFSQHETIGKKLAELIIPEQFRKKHNQLLSNVSKEYVSRREFGLTAIRKNETTFPVDLSMVTVKIQEQNCLLSIIKDITEWKTMEEKLRQERDLLESVATSTNIILATINRDYRITWVNQKGNLATKFGNLENQICYKTFGHDSPNVCEGCGVKRVFHNNESVVRRDYTFIDSEGKEKWVELISTPIKDKNGYVNSALEISIDITERKQLQNKLAVYSQRLEEIVLKRTDELKKTQVELVKSERLAAIGELAGMIGHDLRNPLTGIKNSAYYLKKKGQDLPQEQKEMLDTIDKCVDYSNRIINDLLDYSREIHLIVEKHSPKKLLNESLIFITIPQQVSVKNGLDESAYIMVDSDKIKRVFINLIKNAVEAMPEGGEITINDKENKDTIEIAFTDTGVGIDEETLPKLFAPLFTTKAQGMGFGLAICKRIIEAHKGTIVVKSVKGQGTTFTLTLPVNLKMEFGGEKEWINNPAYS